MSTLTPDIPILINCRDRISSLRALVAWLERAGHENLVLVDNDSSYPSLLEFYEKTPHRVVRLGANLGPEAVWTAGIVDEVARGGEYVLTDSDVVPDDAAPSDAVDRFGELLERYPDVDKVGFGLRIDDLPSCYRFRREVVDWETQFWQDEVEAGVYRADLDTTFARYRGTVRSRTFPALRTGFPCVARHLPWYGDSAHPTDEDLYYKQHARVDMTNWDADELPGDLRAAIEHHRSVRAGTADQV